MGLFSKKVSCVGLDIGEQSIKFIGLRKNAGGYEIIEFVNAAALPAMELKADRVHVVAAVSGDNVMVRNLTLPVMPDNELMEAVRFEAEAIFPVTAKDAAIDCLKYGMVSEKGIRKQEVLVVAVRNEAIKKLQATGKAAGIEPDTIDIEPLALQRAVGKLNPSIVPVQSNYAIVHIGFVSTNISIFRDDCLFFTRSLNTGEQKLIASLDKIDELVTDIGRSLQYYSAEHRGQEVAKIFVTGEGAMLEGLNSQMSGRLNIPVEVFDPTEYLHINPKIAHTTQEIRASGTALAQVVGLALSEVD